MACNQGRSGACCVDGNCTITFENTCDSLGGVFQGPGSNCEQAYCDTVPHPGRCCFPDGHCEVLLHSDCVEAGGAIWTSGQDCLTPCPAPGACCLPDGVCVMVIRDSCERIGGVFQGENVACGETICQPVVTRRGTWGSIKMMYR
jgi:hypothetical protein